MGPNDVAKVGMENVKSVPQEELFFACASVENEDCEILEPVVTVSIPDSSPLKFFLEDSAQWDVVQRVESPVQNAVVMHQTLSRKSTNEISNDPLVISPSKKSSSSDNSEILRSLLLKEAACAMESEWTVTEVSNTLNTRIAHRGYPMPDAYAAQRGRRARGTRGTRGARGARGAPGAPGARGARGAHHAQKGRPAQNSRTFPPPIKLRPAYMSLPAHSTFGATPIQGPMKTLLPAPLQIPPPIASRPASLTMPAGPVPRPVKAPLPKPLPQPPEGVDFLMVRRHLDDVLQKIITKVTRSERKRNSSSTPRDGTANIDIKTAPDSVSKRLKSFHPSSPVDANVEIADAANICNIGEEQREVELNPKLQSDPNRNFSSMCKQVSIPPSTSGNVDVTKLKSSGNVDLAKLQNCPKLDQVSGSVVELDVNTVKYTTDRGSGELRECVLDLTPPTGSNSSLVNDETPVHGDVGSYQHVNSNSSRSLPNTVRDMLLSEQNMDQLTVDALINITPGNPRINEHARSSFPPFTFTKGIIKEVSPKTASVTPSPESTLKTQAASVASRGRVSVPVSEADTALSHFPSKYSEFEISREHNSKPPKRRRSEETTQQQTERRGRGETPGTSRANNSSVDTHCVDGGGPIGELREMAQKPLTPPSVMTKCTEDAQSTASSLVESLSRDDPELGVGREVFPSYLDDSASLLSSNSQLPPGNYLTSTKPKVIPPWRRRSNDTMKLRSEPRDRSGTPFNSSTGSGAEVSSEIQCSGQDKVLVTSKKRAKVGESRANASAPICDLCGRGFSSFCQLTSHVRLHTGSARCFFCSLCKQRFLHFDALVSHARRRHEVKLLTTASKGGGATVVLQRPFAYSCSVCGEVLAGRATLVNHMLSQHSAPSGRAVDDVAPALLAGTRMRGTAPSIRLHSSSAGASAQSSTDTLQPHSSSDLATACVSNAPNQSSIPSEANGSQGRAPSLRRSPSPIAVSSRSNSPFSSRTTISPPHSVLSVNSESDTSQDSIDCDSSSSLNLSSNSHQHVTQKDVQPVTSDASNCPIHSSSNIYLSSVNKTLKEIKDSSSGKVSSLKHTVQTTQKVGKTPCPVHSSSLKNKTSDTNSCPVHKNNRTQFSDNAHQDSLCGEQLNVVEQKSKSSSSKAVNLSPLVVIPKLSYNSLISPNSYHTNSSPLSSAMRKLKPCISQSRCSLESSSPHMCVKKSFNLHSNPPTSGQVTKSIKKSKPHCPKHFPKANIPLDPSSSSLHSLTSLGRDLNSSSSTSEQHKSVVNRDDIESITVD